MDTATQRKLAIATNGETWTLLQKADRSPDETELMLHTAHASWYHWHFVGNKLNEQRAEWLLARVYTVIGRSEPALYHAKRCLALTVAHPELLEDFDPAFAYEGFARASALAGDREVAIRFKQIADEAGQKIADPEDKEIWDKDFAAGPWFDLL